MFVRWKRRGASRDAVVVENKRDGKKIRQRVICHLGVVHEKTAHELRDRVLFWQWTAPKLDRLKLPDEVRARLEAQLSEVIPYADEATREAYTERGWARVNELLGRGQKARRSA